MQKTPLYLYLEKTAQGDTSFSSKLCQQLADRLIYVPIVSGPAGKQSSRGALTVKVVRVDTDDQNRVPIFTTEKAYKTWAASHGEPTQFISLLGGDFCGALEPETWIVVDPGAEHSVALEPSFARKIATSVPEDLSTPPTEVPDVLAKLRGRSEPTSLMKRPKHNKSAGEAPQLESRPQSSSSSTAALLQGIKKEEFAPYRPIEPTTPDPNQRSTEENVHAALNRPVIFSPDTDANSVIREKEDPNKKKRRSFLSFLKGNQT